MTTDDENLLDFETAMNDFATMFPTASREKIENVLRQHDGDVDASIEQLLTETMLATTVASPPAPPRSPRPTNRPPPPQPARPPRPLPQSMIPIEPPPPYEATTSSPRRYPLPTPPPVSAPPRYAAHRETFQFPPRPVRSGRLSFDDIGKERRKIEMLKRENERKLDTVCDEKEARILEDEQIAIILQNKELAKCLRDPRSGTVRSRSVATAAVQQRRRSSSNREQNHGPPVPDGPILDEAIIANDKDFKEKLASLSRASRQRLSQLAYRLRRSES